MTRYFVEVQPEGSLRASEDAQNREDDALLRHVPGESLLRLDHTTDEGAEDLARAYWNGTCEDPDQIDEWVEWAQDRKPHVLAMDGAGWSFGAGEPPDDAMQRSYYQGAGVLVGKFDAPNGRILLVCWPGQQVLPQRRFLMLDMEWKTDAFASELPSPQEAIQILQT